jgi:hypothetical protein
VASFDLLIRSLLLRFLVAGTLLQLTRYYAREMSDFDSADDWHASEPAGTSLQDAIDLIQRQGALVMAIATQGPRIETVDHQYQHRRRRIRRALEGSGVHDPFPWSSLWEARQALQTVGGWADRRAEVHRLMSRSIEDLERRLETIPLDDDMSAAGPNWADVDRRVDEMKDELARATTLDGYQDVGRRCREIIAAAVNVVFSDDLVPMGEDTPATGDAKRRLDVYLAASFGGSAHDELRAFLRRLLALANAVAHDEESAPLTAYAAAQGCISFVRIMQFANRASADRWDL